MFVKELKSPRAVDRRTFLEHVAMLSGAGFVAACAGSSSGAAAGTSTTAAMNPSLSAWRDKIGLQLFTVRDKFPADFAGTLEAVSRIGYREVQTTLTYGNHTLPEIKSYLDRAGLTAPATHVSPPAGPDFEKTLDAYAAIGHRYTTVNTGDASGGRGGRSGRAGGAGAAGTPPSLAGDLRAMQPPVPPQTLDAVKRTAQQLNDAGRITQKHGLKVIVHNHTTEFQPLADSALRPYDVLIAETDPNLVALELDIGWAMAAGENVLDLFKRNPGRFEVWHVKDVRGLAALHRVANQNDRMRTADIVPLGDGDIDYRAIFANATLAGMKHFFVEQDTAPQSGDSLAAAAASYRYLARLFA